MSKELNPAFGCTGPSDCSDAWLRAVDTLMSMCIAERTGLGTTKEAFVQTLRRYADEMEKLSQPNASVSSSDGELEYAPGACSALALAEQFHATYERLAPEYGYETRPETRVFDPASANGKLMIAVCDSIIQQNASVSIPGDEPEYAPGDCYAENIRKVYRCIGLLNSMVRGGERHSDTSARMTVEALDALGYLEQHNAGMNLSGDEPE